jgi:lipopolysaccharide transport protein LptA
MFSTRNHYTQLGAAVFALAITVAPGLLSAQLVEAQERQQIGDMIVKAAETEFDFMKNIVVFTGSVDLVSKSSHMTADKMTVYLTPKRELVSATCVGSVFIEKKNPEQGTTMTARGRTLEYSERDQKANLEGDTVVHLGSPRLAKPALVTGARIDMDLKSQQNVVVGTGGAQAKVHLEPKTEEGKPAPEPVDLTADRIEMNSVTQEYIATGKPVMTRPSSKLQARRIRFMLEEDGRDVKVAYAENDVVYDSRSEDGDTTHATGNNGVYTREITELVLEGAVNARTKEAKAEKPTIYQGEKFIYNTRTGVGKLIKGHIIFPDPPAQRDAPKAVAAPAAPAAPAGGDSKKK